jgi:hypothetical protein
LYLALGTALLAVAVGALAVAHHDASGGVWSLELAALGRCCCRAALEAAIGGLALLAGALTLGLWPLHGWLVAGDRRGATGPAMLIAGPVRWLGVDLLLRLWLPLTPTAAAAQAPAIAWVAVLGAVYGGLWRAPRGTSGGRSGWRRWCRRGCWCWGWSGSTTRGVLGALGLALSVPRRGGGAAGAGGAGLAGALGALGLLPAPGLVGLVGAALVLIGTARFAGLTLGGRGMGVALVAAAAVALVAGGWRAGGWDRS